MNLFELFVKIGADTSQAEKGMKNTQKNSETLTNKIKVMSAQFESAQKNVDKLTKEFNESVQKTGAASKETQELAKKLDDAEKEAEQAKKALDGYNSELGETEEKAEKAGGGLSNFASKLGKGLATAAKIGTAAVGAAAAGIAALTTAAVNNFSEYEQLAGGAQKIFDQMDYSKIEQDASNAYKELGLSANQYLAVINDVGATFAATMGDEAGYEAAKTGLKAISDYASGTGKNVDELSQKFTLITRSTSSYQSIADQFSGILPATSAGFLEQAQAAGILSDSYTQLTEVPIDEYQAAVSQMLEQGVSDLGLANNTAAEAMTTISGSLSMAKASWQNFTTALAGGGDVESAITNLAESVFAVGENILPVAENTLNTIVNLVGDLAPKIAEKIPELFKRILPPLLTAAVSLVKTLAQYLPEILGSLIDAIVASSPLIIEGIVTAFEAIVEMLPELIQQIADALPVLVPQIIAGIAQMVVILVQNLPAILSSLTEAFIGLFAGAWGGIEEIFNLDKVGEFFSGVWNGIQNAFGSVSDWFSDTFTDAWEGVKKVFSTGGEIFAGIADGIADTFKEVVNAIIRGINSVIAFPFDTINGFLNKIRNASFLGVSPFKKFWKQNPITVPQIPLLARGGIVDSATLAMIGENGREAIVPLENNKGWIKEIAGEMSNYMGSGGDIYININGAKYSDENALAEAIAEKLQSMTDRRSAVYA